MQHTGKTKKNQTLFLYKVLFLPWQSCVSICHDAVLGYLASRPSLPKHLSMLIHGYSKPLRADVVWHHFPKTEAAWVLSPTPPPLPLCLLLISAETAVGKRTLTSATTRKEKRCFFFREGWGQWVRVENSQKAWAVKGNAPSVGVQ